MLCGISVSLETLSPARGQITHVLLTRSPLYLGTEAPFRVRLACLIHAASVRSEPGSNSPLKNVELFLLLKEKDLIDPFDLVVTQDHFYRRRFVQIAPLPIRSGYS